jgi:hypothetical protein
LADGDIDRTPETVEHTDGEVHLVRSGGIVVINGAEDAVNRLIADDPALRTARRVDSSTDLVTGALKALTDLMGTPGGGGPAVFQIQPAGQDLSASDGFFRLLGQLTNGNSIDGRALKPITMGPQQLLSAQLAVATIALTAAIKEVQEAVERVEDKVDVIRDILDAERDGQIIGANRALRRRAEHLGFDEAMSDADWGAVDDIGVEVEQQIEGLRSFIRKRLAAAEDEGRRISGRLDAVEIANDLAETLALLIVAQDSLFLFQQMRVLRIKATQLELAPAAVEEAQALLDQHAAEDTELIQRLRTLVAERVEVEALEVLRFRTATEIVEVAPKIDETLSWFAEQRGLSYDSFEVPSLPGAAEVVDEVKARGETLASGGKRAFGELTGKFRRWKSGRRTEAGDAAKGAPEEPDAPVGEV